MFALQDLLQGTLAVIVPGVIGLAAWTICFLVVRATKIRRVLREKIGFLVGIPADQLIPRFPTVDESFKKSTLLKGHWREFDSSLVKKPNQVLTTIDAGNFFNEFTLVDSPLAMEFYRHVPGILTALGIVGTFLGLIDGLHGFDREHLNDSIIKLFGGISAAFNCSFIAISLSVAVTIVERTITTGLYSQVNRLNEGLNRLFNRSLTEDYLHDMVGQMDQQTQSLKSFSQDLAGAIRQAMEELVDKQSQALTNANQLVADQVAQAMGTTLSPAVDRLVMAVENIQQQHADSSHQALNELVSQFSETMAQSTGRQIDGLLAGMTTTTETLGGLKNEMTGFVGTVQEQMATQKAHLEELVARTMTSSSDSQRQMQEELGKFLGQTAERLEKLQRQLTEESGASVTRLGFELTQMVSRSAEQQQEALRAVAGTVAETQASMDRKMADLVAGLQAASGEQTRQLSAGVQSTVEQLRGETQAMLHETSGALSGALERVLERTESLAENSARLNSQMGERFERLAGLLEDMASRTTQATSLLNEQLGQSAERLGKLSQGIEGLLGTFDTTLGKQRQLLGDTIDGIGRLQTASEAVSSASRHYDETHQATIKTLAAITVQTSLAEDRLSEFSKVVSGLKEHNSVLQATLDRHVGALGSVRGETESFFREVNEQVRAFSLAVKTAMEQYHDVASAKMGKFLGEVDTGFATCIKSLSTTTTELEDVLGALLDSGAANGGGKNVGRKSGN